MLAPISICAIIHTSISVFMSTLQGEIIFLLSSHRSSQNLLRTTNPIFKSDLFETVYASLLSYCGEHTFFCFIRLFVKESVSFKTFRLVLHQEYWMFATLWFRTVYLLSCLCMYLVYWKGHNIIEIWINY